MADRTPPQKTVTARGNFQVDITQYKYGSASGLSDGTTDYLEVTYHSDLNSSSRTFECFVRFNSIPTNGQIYLFDNYDPNGGDYGLGAGESFYINISSGVKTLTYKMYGDYDDGASNAEQYTLASTVTLTTGTWYHFAFERNNSTRSVAIYHDGTRKNNGTENLIEGVKLSTLNTFLMASRPSGGSSLDGWADEIRMSNVLRYNSSTYTVPASAFEADNNTTLLLHCEGADASTTFTDDITLPSGSTNVTISGAVATATANFENATIIVTSNINILGAIALATATFEIPTINTTSNVNISGAEATAIARFLTPNFGPVLTENPNFSYLGKNQISLMARNRSEFYFYSQR